MNKFDEIYLELITEANEQIAQEDVLGKVKDFFTSKEKLREREEAEEEAKAKAKEKKASDYQLQQTKRSIEELADFCSDRETQNKYDKFWERVSNIHRNNDGYPNRNRLWKEDAGEVKAAEFKIAEKQFNGGRGIEFKSISGDQWETVLLPFGNNVTPESPAILMYNDVKIVGGENNPDLTFGKPEYDASFIFDDIYPVKNKLKEEFNETLLSKHKYDGPTPLNEIIKELNSSTNMARLKLFKFIVANADKIISIIEDFNRSVEAECKEEIKYQSKN